MRLISLLFVFGLAATLTACGDSSTPSEVINRSEVPADDVIYGLHHVMTKDGVRSAVLDSDTAYLIEAGQRFDLRGVELKFFAENGSQTGTLTSETGEYDAQSGSFVARGDAVLITRGEQGERRLETPELYYEVRTDQLWSDSSFVLTEGGTVTRGTSFRSDAKGTTWTARGLRSEGVEAGGSGLSF